MTLLKRLAIVLILFAGCRTVAPVSQLQSSMEPNISRVMLKNGNVVVFNRDFGWYNKHAATVDGTTTDSQHVEYHVSELSKVETVRAYALIPLVITGGMLLGVGIYVMAKILALL